MARKTKSVTTVETPATTTRTTRSRSRIQAASSESESQTSTAPTTPKKRGRKPKKVEETPTEEPEVSTDVSTAIEDASSVTSEELGEEPQSADSSMDQTEEVDPEEEIPLEEAEKEEIVIEKESITVESEQPEEEEKTTHDNVLSSAESLEPEDTFLKDNNLEQTSDVVEEPVENVTSQPETAPIASNTAIQPCDDPDMDIQNSTSHPETASNEETIQRCDDPDMDIDNDDEDDPAVEIAINHSFPEASHEDSHSMIYSEASQSNCPISQLQTPQQPEQVVEEAPPPPPPRELTENEKRARALLNQVREARAKEVISTTPTALTPLKINQSITISIPKVSPSLSSADSPKPPSDSSRPSSGHQSSKKTPLSKRSSLANVFSLEEETSSKKPSESSKLNTSGRRSRDDEKHERTASRKSRTPSRRRRSSSRSSSPRRRRSRSKSRRRSRSTSRRRRRSRSSSARSHSRSPRRHRSRSPYYRNDRYRGGRGGGRGMSYHNQRGGRRGGRGYNSGYRQNTNRRSDYRDRRDRDRSKSRHRSRTRSRSYSKSSSRSPKASRRSPKHSRDTRKRSKSPDNRRRSKSPDARRRTKSPETRRRSKSPDIRKRSKTPEKKPKSPVRKVSVEKVEEPPKKKEIFLSFDAIRLQKKLLEEAKTVETTQQPDKVEEVLVKPIENVEPPSEVVDDPIPPPPPPVEKPHVEEVVPAPPCPVVEEVPPPPPTDLIDDVVDMDMDSGEEEEEDPLKKAEEEKRLKEAEEARLKEEVIRRREEEFKRIEDEHRKKRDEERRRKEEAEEKRKAEEREEAARKVEEALRKMEEARQLKEKEEKDAARARFPKFQEIETLIYMDDKYTKTGKKVKRAVETSLFCDCRQNGKNCSDNSCINREMLYECPSSCGSQCQNRRFSQRQYAPVEAFYTGPDKGWGVRTTAVIKKGTFIIEYIGEVVSNEDFAARQKKYAKDPNHTHHYIFELGQKLIDATVKGNCSRFINHSCEPNAICLKWAVPKTPRDVSRIGFFANRDIEIGEEVTFDYKFCNYGRTAQTCHCGTPSCKGVIGQKPEFDSDTSDAEDEEIEEMEEPDDDDENKENEEQKLINSQRQMEASAISHLNDLLTRDNSHRLMRHVAAKVVKFLAHVITTENRLRMQSLIGRVDDPFYEQLKRYHLYDVLCKWVSSPNWSRHDILMKHATVKMMSEIDNENFWERAKGWSKESFTTVSSLTEMTIPDEAVAYDVVQYLVDSLDDDDNDDDVESGNANMTNEQLFNEIIEIASKIAADADIKKNVETNGINIFKIPKKKRDARAAAGEDPRSATDRLQSKSPDRSFKRFNREFSPNRSNKRKYEENRFGSFGRRDDSRTDKSDDSLQTQPEVKRVRKSRFDDAPATISVSLSPANSLDSLKSPQPQIRVIAKPVTDAPPPEVFGAAPPPWPAYPPGGMPPTGIPPPFAMGAIPPPFPMMPFHPFPPPMPGMVPPVPVYPAYAYMEGDKKLEYFMGLSNDELKEVKSKFELDLALIESAIRRKEAEANLARAQKEAAAAAAEAAALAINTIHGVRASSPPPPPVVRKKEAMYIKTRDESGACYYYHKETRAATWDLPEGETCVDDTQEMQQPDSSVTDLEEAQSHLDIAARVQEIFSSPAGSSKAGTVEQQHVEDVQVEQKPFSAFRREDSEADMARKAKIFKLELEREVQPIILSYLKRVSTADNERTMWLIKQVAKEMFKRETSNPSCEYHLNDSIRKKVHQYTKSFMVRKTSDGGRDLWKGYEKAV